MYEIAGFDKELITKALNCSVTLRFPKWLLYFQKAGSATRELKSREFGREIESCDLWLLKSRRRGLHLKEVCDNWHVCGLEGSELVYGMT